MKFEIKPEQAALLERAQELGIDPEQLLIQAFAVIREQLEDHEGLLEDREAVAAHIAEGCAQADRNDLLAPDEAKRILRERRAKRQVA